MREGPFSVREYLPELAPDVPAAERLRRNLYMIEKAIGALHFEHAVAFDSEACMVLEKSGDPGAISFSPAEMFVVRHSTMTHGHPQGGTFSPSDLQFAVLRELVEIRASGVEQGVLVTYSIRPTNEGWLSGRACELLSEPNTNERAFVASLLRLRRTHLKEAFLEEMEKPVLGRSLAEFEAAVAHLAVDRLAQELGYIYSREEMQ